MSMYANVHRTEDNGLLAIAKSQGVTALYGTNSDVDLHLRSFALFSVLPEMFVLYLMDNNVFGGNAKLDFPYLDPVLCSFHTS